jgi:hypothetical protein
MHQNGISEGDRNMKPLVIGSILMATLMLAACHHNEAVTARASSNSAHVSCLTPSGSILYEGDSASGTSLTVGTGGIEFVDAKTGHRLQFYGATCSIDHGP